MSTSLSLNVGTNEMCLLISKSMSGLTGNTDDATGRGEEAFTGVCTGVFPCDTGEGERRARLFFSSSSSSFSRMSRCVSSSTARTCKNWFWYCCRHNSTSSSFNRITNNGSFGEGLTGSMRAASSDLNSASAASKSSDKAEVATPVTTVAPAKTFCFTSSVCSASLISLFSALRGTAIL